MGYMILVSGTKQVVAGMRYRLNFDVCNESKTKCDAFQIDFVHRSWDDDKISVSSCVKVDGRDYDKNEMYKLKTIENVDSLEEKSENIQLIDKTTNSDLTPLFVLVVLVVGAGFAYSRYRRKSLVGDQDGL